MTGLSSQSSRRAWDLSRKQHGVIGHDQLVELGLSRHAIAARLHSRRLHRLFRGVYAVGRPEVGAYGRWFAAVMACGEAAALSHRDALALWGIRPKKSGPIHVSIPYPGNASRSGIAVHRRFSFGARDVIDHYGIRVTTPALTLVDVALGTSDAQLERDISEADQRGVIRFDALLREIERMPQRPGLGRIKRLIFRHTFRLSRSQLERVFRPLGRRAGLGDPESLAIVNGVEVDFWFEELGLAVEAKSLTYHRTPAKQNNDVIRDHRHVVNDVLPLHFTHWQIAKQPRYVEGVLRNVARRRRRSRAS
jgi:hypothetical protein